MIEFTEKLRERLFNQGWKFDHEEGNINGEEMYFSHEDFPGVVVRETAFGFFNMEIKD